jgi:hypothetical protein
MDEILKEDPEVRLTDALVADLLSLSDGELLTELAEDEVDPERDAATSRAVIAAALIRLAVEKTGNASDAASSGNRPIRSTPIPTDAANLLNRVVGNDGLASELTLAARNGRGLSGRELEDIVRDLHELGAFGANDPQAG